MQEGEIVKYENRALQKINNAISITNKFLFVNLKPINIFWLEDHKIFFDGGSICILKKFPNAIFKHFENGDEALLSIPKLLKENLVDIIITDIRHPGIDGIKFSKAIRLLESDKSGNIPILFISMMDDIWFRDQIKTIPFTSFLIKTASEQEIVLAINNLI